jgi:hypothetical protein
MRIATYILAGLGVLAWGTPIAIIIRILLGYERGLFGLLASIILSDAPPYARLATFRRKIAGFELAVNGAGKKVARPGGAGYVLIFWAKRTATLCRDCASRGRY